MKKVYLQPRTEDVPLHAGELMIPSVGKGSGGQTTGGPLNPVQARRLPLDIAYI